MDWMLVYMLLILKIPVIAAILLVWWAVRSEPEPADDDGEGRGNKPDDDPRPRRPRPPRRGPHADPVPAAPPRRVRVGGRHAPVAARSR